MKNAVFWDIKTLFVLHRKHIVSATEPSQLMLVKLEVFTAVTIENAVFCDARPCGSCKNRTTSYSRRWHSSETDSVSASVLFFAN
jgi:hypothetical protein